MALTYLATKTAPLRLRNASLKGLVNFIMGQGDPTFVPVSHDYETKFPETSVLSELQHRIFIFASTEEKTAIGLLELFGNLRFSIILTNEWDGPNLSHVYIVDPITCKQEEHELYPPINIKETIAARGYNRSRVEAAFNSIFSAVQKKVDSSLISSIIDQAMEKHMVGKGPIITAEMISNLAREVSLEFVRHSSRIDSEEDIDLKDFIKNGK